MSDILDRIDSNVFVQNDENDACAQAVLLRDCKAEIEWLRIRLQECRDVLCMTKLVREEGYTIATARKIGCEDNYSSYGAQGLARRVKIATDCAIANADRQLSVQGDSE